MPDNLLPNVNRVELDRVSSMTPSGMPYSAQAAVGQTLMPGAVMMPAENAFREKADVKQEKKFSGPLTDLKFKIDEKTKDVTILILDRETRKVVRSIPPEEISKLEPGELLELFT